MSYTLTGIAFVVVCIALFAWRMLRKSPTIVSGEPVQPELTGPTGLATGDYSGIAAGPIADPCAHILGRCTRAGRSARIG